MKNSGRIAALTRRQVLTAGSAATAVLAMPSLSFARGVRIVIIGAGAGGGTAARLLVQQLGDKADILVLTGPSKTYYPPFLQTGRLLGEAAPTVDLGLRLGESGVATMAGSVIALDRRRKQVTVQRNETRTQLPYDLLIAAPGVSLGRYGETAGGEPDPCWTAGSACSAGLPGLAGFPEGGTLGIVAPPQPYRCPPAVYERACLLAHRLQGRDPSAKILIVDEKDGYPMQALFEAAYADYYDDAVEWIPREFHGGVKRIDFRQGLIETDFEAFEVDLVHAVPPQSAPDFLIRAGLADATGYCPVEAISMQSATDPDVYLVGDVAAAGEMSKSAGSAIAQAGLAVAHLVERVAGHPAEASIDLADQCWTFLTPDDAVTLGGRYRPEGRHFASVERFVSDVEEDETTRCSNAREAAAWPAMMLQQIYGAVS
ncbi:FAD-dependent oxidoreductase [Pelagibius litoralis]|uniref:FAD-dependent oxidoreductase n=1 Tax=Pelagibius litoralis TaxID=374515 RepID=A0A967EYF6_9PROT|nr:FAD-dependent oxidoreductase [Pelagibius litoralis]NIA69726.1 FAD-dependent oxidoreductase [Pelagibius litoralis]